MDRKRITPQSVKVLDAAKGIVASIVAVCGNVDDGNDRIRKGAFTKTIQERGNRLHVLDGHNTDSIRDIVGVPINIQEVGRDQLPPDVLAAFPDATGGLYAETQFLIETPEGKGVFDRLAAGAAFEWSIGYDAVDTGYSEGMRDGKKIRVRDLNTVKLWEYSPVIWGMNAGTSTLSIKDGKPAAGESKRKATRRLFEKAIANIDAGADPETIKLATEKEMVAYDAGGSGEFPVQRLADVLYGATRSDYMALVDSWLVQGVLSGEEHAGLVTLGDEHLGFIRAAIPADVGARQVCYYGEATGWMAARDPGEEKAGRVLSATNAASILTALTTLTEVLTRAGVLDVAEAAEAEQSAEKDAAGPSEGDVTPTDLEQRIRVAQLEIELMELAEEHDNAAHTHGSS